MAIDGPEVSWWKQHASAVFILFLVILSGCLLAVGLILQDRESYWGHIGVFLIQLSGSTIAAAICTVFLSFGDLKRYMANTVGSLLATGSLVPSLSSNARNTLDLALTRTRLDSEIRSFDPSLYEHLSHFRLKDLSTFTLHNAKYHVNLSPWEQDSRFLVRETIKSYRISARHFRERPSRFTLSAYAEVHIPDNADIGEDDFLREFQVRVGQDIIADVEGAIVTRMASGSLPVQRIEYEAVIDVEDEVDIRMHLSTLSTPGDPVEIINTRWPTKGFDAILRFSSNFCYDCVWFRSREPGQGMTEGNSQIDQMSDGISAETHDWLLPGEGLVMYWQPK